LTLTPEGLQIAVANTFIAGWIENHFARVIQNALKSVKGATGPVYFTVIPL